VSYRVQFHDSKEPLRFRDSEGGTTSVSCFGIPPEDHDKFMEMRGQVRVLYDNRRRVEELTEPEEFVLDPCEYTEPYQLMLARVQPRKTLRAAVEDVEQKIIAHPARCNALFPTSVLLVPKLHWEVTHHFREIERLELISEAVQIIRFKLDRRGAELASEAHVSVIASGSSYELDRPFLIIMKKRDRRNPVFVMWVANDELLTPFNT
jgi:hypothetical protein